MTSNQTIKRQSSDNPTTTKKNDKNLNKKNNETTRFLGGAKDKRKLPDGMTCRVCDYYKNNCDFLGVNPESTICKKDIGGKSKFSCESLIQ